METLLRKYLWAIDLAVIAICAIFSARATATLIQTRITRIIPPVRAVPRPLAAASTGTYYGKQVEDILKRNIFCSTCPPILAKPVEVGTGPAPDPPLQRTSLPLKLLAVMFAPPPGDPRWSVAIIRDVDEKSVGPYSIGSKVREALITDIEEARIYLEVSGRKEYLDLLDKGPSPTPGVPPPVVAAAPASDPVMAELDRGIKKIGEHNYEVQRQTVDSLLGNMSLLSRSARIVPEIRDGKAAGFRLFSVRPDGPFGKIGLQNGDVISSINGLEMTSPDKALEVYTKLKSASHLSVGLERNGQKINKEYNIR
ncbi:MAG TPA: type II secretion system protein GspC [Polyangia bacterium]|jgi:general secretion pathway protein C|nr:type II secretion system protein GspC [Polyangia bacterium]